MAIGNCIEMEIIQESKHGFTIEDIRYGCEFAAAAAFTIVALIILHLASRHTAISLD